MSSGNKDPNSFISSSSISVKKYSNFDESFSLEINDFKIKGIFFDFFSNDSFIFSNFSLFIAFKFIFFENSFSFNSLFINFLINLI